MHNNCGCSVTYENGRKRQDVWSKREWEAPFEDARAGEPVVLTEEQAEKIQAEHGLTIMPNDGKINSEKEFQLLENFLSQQDMTGTIYTHQQKCEHYRNAILNIAKTWTRILVLITFYQNMKVQTIKSFLLSVLQIVN